MAALDNVSLVVPAGRFVSLVGPSGCGKSTLLRLVGGLLAPSAGTVRVGQHDATEGRATKRFALTPQQPALLPWRTVRQNARLLLDVNPQPDQAANYALVDSLLDEVGLSEFADALPHQLSGGMQQRVALVRTFALGASVLLLDEPFAALDELTRSDMRHLLLRLWNHHRSTALLVTHSVTEAVLLSDEVIVLSGRPGHIVARETIDLDRSGHAEVEDTPGFQAHIRRIRAALRGTS